MTRLPIVALLSLAACNAPVPESGGGASTTTTAGSTGTRYDCDTGSTVFASGRGGSVTVTLDDGTAVRMSRVRGAALSGTTYSGGGYVWFTEGDTAVLTEQGGQTNCRISAL